MIIFKSNNFSKSSSINKFSKKYSFMKKSFCSLVLFLCVISIVSIGFSSRIVTNEQLEMNIKVNSGAVNDKYKLFSFDEIKPFKFNKYGVLVDDVYQSKGEIAIQFKLKSNGGLSLFYAEGFDLNFTLTSLNSINLVSYLSNESGSVEYHVNNSDYVNWNENSPSGTCNAVIEDTSVSSTLVYNNALDDFDLNDYLYFVIVYNFDFSSVFADFENQIYEYLIKDNSIIFDFFIGIE